jgi:hypothetical protein
MQQKWLLQKTAQSTKHKTRARVKRKKGPKYPYDKWVNMRGENEEAAVGRRALRRSLTIKVILPDTTLAQKVATPKSMSQELSTQTVQHLTTPPQSVVLSSTSSLGDVYETETFR